ncbi:hypothetical protein O3M35_003339 [Rhynocoris fuscipes]|uniref:Protein kinase domain-containing protein n=1 Tax=Rhynocoris fuscipes TaxID=488301 RepID=A0AAW1CQH6_9HEMI
MGNGKSQPAGLVIEDKAFIANNFWTLHNAVFGNDPGRNVTVFAGVTDSNAEFSALEMFSKNLMLHRHPNILKYVASWKVNEQIYLATEEVNTLQNVINKQTSLQICIGLHSILKAISFLHEKALSSHNNICQASIYVTPDGYWKLGGLEYLCRFSDLSARFLSESRKGRYDRGVSPNESNRVPQPPSAIDQYAFGVLVEEILKTRADADVPGLIDFLDIAKKELQAADCKSRPTITSLLEHPYFNHQFISIHNFLTELPIKSDNEKEIFFRELTSKLGEFNEELVAGQLGSLLLSRILLLDRSAQEYFLPQILKPRNADENPNCLFSEETFREYIVPKLMSIFCVRDSQVRLILLNYFKSFTSLCSATELRSQILPELLVGIKDTNDELVAATLRALSELVPILGSATVIGGWRCKHFSDGRPKVHGHSKNTIKTIIVTKAENKESSPGVIPVEENREIFMRERPSPDGGEAHSINIGTEIETQSWDTWETTPNVNNEIETDVLINLEQLNDDVIISESLSNDRVLTTTSVASTKPVENLDVLDIKTKPLPVQQSNEEDFFRDMEPVISKTHVLHITEPIVDKSITNRNKFDVTDDLIGTADEGWGDELDWADVNDESDIDTNRNNIQCD